MLIARGMTVQGTDGDLGTVAEVVADEGVDVFRGIIVAHGLFGAKHGFVAADAVTRVEQNTVSVSLSKTQVNELPAPPSGGQAYEERDLEP